MRPLLRVLVLLPLLAKSVMSNPDEICSGDIGANVCSKNGDFYKTACHALVVGKIKPTDLLCRLPQGKDDCQKDCKENQEVQDCFNSGGVPQCSTNSDNLIYRNPCAAAHIDDDTRDCGGAADCDASPTGKCCDLEKGKCRNW